MGNCMYGQRQSNQNYIDKNIRVQRTIGANFSISKGHQKIGLDTDLQGTLTTTRDEKYINNIPAIVDVVNTSTQT